MVQRNSAGRRRIKLSSLTILVGLAGLVIGLALTLLAEPMALIRATPTRIVAVAATVTPTPYVALTVVERTLVVTVTRIPPTPTSPPTETIEPSPTELATERPVPTNTPIPTGTPPISFPTMQPGSTGQLSFDYPISLVVEQDSVVTAQLIPDHPQASLNPLVGQVATIKFEPAPSEGPRRTIQYTSVPLYTVMVADLSPEETDLLKITGKQDNKQPVDPMTGASWSWNLHPKKPGHPQITLRLSGEVSINQTTYYRDLVNDSRSITIDDKPLLIRAWDGITGNLLLIFGTSGPVALVLAYLAYRANEEKKKLEAKINEFQVTLDTVQSRLDPKTRDRMAQLLNPPRKKPGRHDE